jgi:hypothetical protein
MSDSLNIFERVAETLKDNQAAAYLDNPSSSKYLQVRPSTDLKEIGAAYPQTKDISLRAAHSLQFDRLPKETISFGRIRIHRSSNLTDCISTAAISAHALILSKRAIEIFKQFDLGNHKIYPAKIIHKWKGHLYSVLHFANDLQPYLDIPNSKFFVANILGGYEFDINIRNEIDYDIKRKEVDCGQYPGTEKWWSVRLKLGVVKNGTAIPDIFTILSSSTRTYISDRLANAILENELTGFEIERVYDLRD